MGKTALILALGAVIIMTTAHLTQDSRQVQSSQEEANYEGKVLAREIAQSGFDVIERRVRRNFSGVRGTWSRIRHGEGHYTISASGVADGPVAISSTGVYAGFEYTINGQLEMDVVPVLDALTIDGEVKKLTVDRDVRVSGLDVNPDGTDGTANDVHAVLATLSDGYNDFRTKMIAANAPGVATAPDIVLGVPALSLAEFAAALRNYGGDFLARYTSDKSLKNVTLGSSDDPGIVVAEKDFTFKGRSKGYGILYAQGDVTFEDDAGWEGVIYIASDGSKFSMKDDAVIFGAVIYSAYASDEVTPSGSSDRGLIGGHFDIDVFEGPNDTSERYHEHEYDDDFDVTGVNLLSPSGCGRGALCWTDVLGNETGIWMDIENEAAGWGTFQVTASAGTGCRAGGPATSSSSSEWSGDQSKKGGWKNGGDDDSSGGSTSCSTQPIPAVNLAGATEGGLSGVVMDVRAVTDIRFNFTALCALALSSPGHVQNDPVNRNGAFTVKIYRAVYTGGSWTKGILVYELPAYHHAGYGKWVLEQHTSCSLGDGVEDETAIQYGDPIEVSLKNDARIQYSSRAVRSLRDLYAEFDFISGGVRRTAVRERVRAITP